MALLVFECRVFIGVALSLLASRNSGNNLEAGGGKWFLPSQANAPIARVSHLLLLQRRAQLTKSGRFLSCAPQFPGNMGVLLQNPPIADDFTDFCTT
jgi:hypothetical protein